MSARPTDILNLILVEDDDGHARLIEKNLQRVGICNQLTHLSSGEEMMYYFFGAGQQIDLEKTLILLDLNLPGMDGYEVLKRMKSESSTRDIPIIVLTTTDNPREIDRCYQLGCNVYITKPVAYEDFSEAIRKLGLMLAVVKVPQGR